jgi:hypothetical protein
MINDFEGTEYTEQGTRNTEMLVACTFRAFLLQIGAQITQIEKMTTDYL